MLTALPLYHIFAFTANLMIFFAVGGRNILIPSPRPITNLKLRHGEGADHLVHRPQHAVHGADERSRGSWRRSDWRLKGTVAGGMALAPAVGERWQQMTKTPVYQGYGLTETSPVVTLNPFHRVKMASIGVPVPGTDVRLVDDRGEDVAARRTRRAAGARPAGDAGLLAAAGRNGTNAQGRMARHRRHRDRWTRTAICRSSIARRT